MDWSLSYIELGSMFWKISVLFWMILDPIGMIPIFASATAGVAPERQNWVITREMLIALALMILTLFFGTSFFSLFSIHTHALSIAGGVILGIIGVQMILAEPRETKTMKMEPLIVPLATPVMAGPGILTTIILYAGNLAPVSTVFFSILLAWGASLPIVLLAPQIKRYIGLNGSVAVERVFGYVIMLLAVQMILRGILTFYAQF